MIRTCSDRLTWRKIQTKPFIIPKEGQPCIIADAQTIFDVVATNGLQTAQFRERIGWPAHVSWRKQDSVGARNFRRSETGCYSTFCREKRQRGRRRDDGGKWAVLPSGRKQDDDVLRAEREAPGRSATADFLGRNLVSRPKFSKTREISSIWRDLTRVMIQSFYCDKNYVILLEQDVATDNETTTIRF